ncbi:MAG: hypothetical protein Q9M13_09945 [Mariprofundales bacterium]|nr:hypothetical protein [Mariprofundales bacterium]
MKTSIISILIMLAIGLASMIAISMSDTWAMKAAGIGAMGLLLVYTIQTFVRDYMTRRTSDI